MYHIAPFVQAKPSFAKYETHCISKYLYLNKDGSFKIREEEYIELTYDIANAILAGEYFKHFFPLSRSYYISEVLYGNHS